MSTTSQNGYSANDRAVIRTATVAGTDVAVPIRKGPAGDLLLHAAARWHREVEPLRAPDGVLDCWGYAERTIRGDATTLSNHASGTAIDLRARAHPLGTDPTANFTTAQVRAISKIVMDYAPALRWGGNYTGRKDGMHIEVVADEVTCSRVLSKFTTTTEGDDVALTDDDIERIARRTADLTITRPTKNFGGDVVGFDQIVNGAEHRASDLQAAVAKLLGSGLAVPTAAGGVDLGALADLVVDRLAARLGKT